MYTCKMKHEQILNNRLIISIERKALLLLLSFLFWSNVFSQNSQILEAGFYEASDSIIIKAYKDSQFISSSFCYNYNTSYICLRTSPNQIISKIINNCHVNDFVISNDTLFFCGYDTNGHGVIGFFDINDYFYNAYSGYHYQDFFMLPDGYYAANLYKLVTYTDHHNTRHVFAIGYTGHPIYQFDYFGCVVDLLDANDGYAYYHAAYVFKSPISLFEDISIVGDYLVTTGFDYSGLLNARIFKKNNPFAIAGIQNNLAEIKGIPSLGTHVWNTDESHVSSSSDGYFSLSSISRTKIGNTGTPWKINFLRVSLSSVISQLPNAINISSQMSCSGFINPNNIHEFLYNAPKNCYSILFQHELGTHIRNIFVEIKPTLDEQIKAYRDVIFDAMNAFTRLNSFDIYNSGNYVFFANKENDDWYKTYHFETSGQQSLCLSEVECTFSEMPTIINYKKSIVEYLRDSTNIQYYQPFEHRPYSLTVKCSH